MINRIKERREELGITQQELADKIGVSLSWIRKIENHKVKPSIQLMVRVSVALDCRVDDLFF